MELLPIFVWVGCIVVNALVMFITAKIYKWTSTPAAVAVVSGIVLGPIATVFAGIFLCTGIFLFLISRVFVKLGFEED